MNSRETKAWRMKLARVLRERESFRDVLESAFAKNTICPEAKEALKEMRLNDALWFPGTEPPDYIKQLENS